MRGMAWRRVWAAVLCGVLAIVSAEAAVERSIEDALRGEIGATSVKELPQSVGYKGKYLIDILQDVDHEDGDAGTFTQRVVVMHRGYDRPTVLVTEGYSANWALSETYDEELAKYFDCNVVFVEHRFFGESRPEGCPWEYMTETNALADLHSVRQLFGKIYDGKWIATGISKGGETTIEYCAYYPEDVDVYVPYVGPLCFTRRDKRQVELISEVKPVEVREAVEALQHEAMERKDSLLADFEVYCLRNNCYPWRVSVEDLYDLCVLEYAYAFFQWYDAAKVPGKAELLSDEDVLAPIAEMASYFTRVDSDMTAFFYQAAYEQGYYAYDAKPFKGDMSQRLAKRYLKKVFLPYDLRSVRYHRKVSRSVKKWLKKNDPHMVLIYGEVDPWTGAGVTWLEDKQNVKVFIKPGGSHLTRINNMEEGQREEVLTLLSGILGIKAKR